MNRNWFTISLLLLTAAIGTAYSGRGSSGYFQNSLIIGGCVLMPLILLIVLGDSLPFLRGTHSLGENPFLFLTMSAGLFLGLSLILGQIFYARAVPTSQMKKHFDL